MFSSEPRCIYRQNPLAEVICQFRFPEILSIASNPPAQFQEAIRADFPRYDRLREMPMPKLQGVPGNMTLQNREPGINHRFLSADGKVRVNLTTKFISVSTTAYTCWEDFAPYLDKPLAEFIRLYQPAYFERVGLRYVNFISREALQLQGTPFRWLIRPQYLGPLAFPGIQESQCMRCNLDSEFTLKDGCHVKIHAGPGRVARMGVQEKEIKFIFDQDLFLQGQLPVHTAAGALQTLHSHGYSIFRGAITDLLHNHLQPK